MDDNNYYMISTHGIDVSGGTDKFKIPEGIKVVLFTGHGTKSCSNKQVLFFYYVYLYGTEFLNILLLLLEKVKDLNRANEPYIEFAIKTFRLPEETTGFPKQKYSTIIFNLFKNLYLINPLDNNLYLHKSNEEIEDYRIGNKQNEMAVSVLEKDRDYFSKIKKISFISLETNESTKDIMYIKDARTKKVIFDSLSNKSLIKPEYVSDNYIINCVPLGVYLLNTKPAITMKPTSKSFTKVKNLNTTNDIICTWPKLSQVMNTVKRDITKDAIFFVNICREQPDNTYTPINGEEYIKNLKTINYIENDFLIIYELLKDNNNNERYIAYLNKLKYVKTISQYLTESNYQILLRNRHIARIINCNHEDEQYFDSMIYAFNKYINFNKMFDDLPPLLPYILQQRQKKQQQHRQTLTKSIGKKRNVRNIQQRNQSNSKRPKI
jgi:hypothetical protein